MSIDEVVFDLFVIIIVFDGVAQKLYVIPPLAENRLLSHYVRYLLLCISHLREGTTFIS
jgi:hypothetical protein